MNFDRDVQADRYRLMQRVVPGVDALYLLMRSAIEVDTKDNGNVLIVGAGGGRELEALAPSEKCFSFTAVDPSNDMLALARRTAEESGCAARTEFVLGETSLLPTERRFDAATALLVMHFLPDDGAKLRFLEEIRSRMKSGGAYIHADVCFENLAAFERMLPWFLRHAELAGLDSKGADTGEILSRGPSVIRALPIVGRARFDRLMLDAGFIDNIPIYQGLWYTMWAARAA